jgi:hypothetical protein
MLYAVPRPVWLAVLEEEEGPVVEVEQHTNRITLVETTCSICVFAIVPEERSEAYVQEPCFGTLLPPVPVGV